MNKELILKREGDKTPEGRPGPHGCTGLVNGGSWRWSRTSIIDPDRTRRLGTEDSQIEHNLFSHSGRVIGQERKEERRRQA